MMKKKTCFGLILVSVISSIVCAKTAKAEELLNVSYDATRALYADINQAFVNEKAKAGILNLTIRNSHGGSATQARVVIDGLDADVVSLALPSDIDAIVELSQRIDPNWRDKFPNEASPYKSAIVFLVRAGNPKEIKDWPDLLKPGVTVIIPNPKTSGGARLGYMAAWGYSLKTNNGNEEAASAFVTALYRKVPILDSGARAASVTFAERRQGDVLITWEDEAKLAISRKPNEMDLIVPTLTIEAEPVVAIVDTVVNRKGTRNLAEDYLRFLYSPTGQEIIVRHHLRPILQDIAEQYKDNFSPINTFTVKEVFGSWQAAQTKHFADGGIFDQIMKR